MNAEFIQRLADVLNDPIIDAVARAGAAKLVDKPYIEPVVVLKLSSAIRVIVRVAATRPADRNTSNRFRILDAMGQPIFTGASFVGLSTTAYMLYGTPWANADVLPADADTVHMADRFKKLLQRPMTLIPSREIC